MQHETSKADPAPVKSNRTGCLTVLLWIFLLLVMLTIAIARSKSIKGWLKAVLIMLVWGFALGIFQGNSRSSKRTSSYSSSYTRTVKPTARTTYAPVVTSTPEPDVLKAQQAVDAYVTSVATPSPDPQTLSDAERIMLSVYNPGIKAHILGTTAEENLRRSIQIATAKKLNMFSYIAMRPVSIVVLCVALLLIGSNLYQVYKEKKRTNQAIK